jgi:hypothetical protein
MSGWSIEPEGVRQVLNRVQDDAKELSTAFGGIADAQESLDGGSGATAASTAVSQWRVAATPLLAPVAAAVLGLLESEQARIAGIATRIEACGVGAGNATMAYLQGDEEMAASTQRSALAAASSGDLTALENRP